MTFISWFSNFFSYCLASLPLKQSKIFNISCMFSYIRHCELFHYCEIMEKTVLSKRRSLMTLHNPFRENTVCICRNILPRVNLLGNIILTRVLFISFSNYRITMLWLYTLVLLIKSILFWKFVKIELNPS